MPYLRDKTLKHVPIIYIILQKKVLKVKHNFFKGTMRKLEIKNERVKHSLGSNQALWLEMWEELLNPATIDPHALPPVNCKTLIDNILFLENESIKDDRKKSIVRGGLDELLHGIYGIHKDSLIKKAFAKTLFAEQPPSLEKAELSTYFEYVKKLSKALTDNDSYYDQLLLNVYRHISEIPSEQGSKEWWKSAEILENMLKSMLVELLKRGFSYKYLRTRLLIFLQNDHFVRGNIQHKIDTLLRMFRKRNPDEYTIILRLHDILEFPHSQVLQNIELTPIVPEELISLINKQLEERKELLKSFFKKTELMLLEEVVLKTYDVFRSSKENIPNSQLQQENNEIIAKIFNFYKVIKSSSFSELLPLIEYIKSLARKLDDFHYSNPQGPAESLRDLTIRVPWAQLEHISHFDTEFAMLDNKQIELECEVISKKRNIGILRAYLFRNCRLKNLEKEIRTFTRALELLQPKNKILFAIIRNVNAQDSIASAKIGLTELNRILSFLRFQYGYTGGEIAQKVIVSGPAATIIDLNDVVFHRHSIKKSVLRPERLNAKVNVIQSNSTKHIIENALRWYGLSIQKGDEVSKFIALWVALESLIAQGTDEPEGPYIAEIGSSMLGLYFVRKTIRNLWADFRRVSVDERIATKFKIHTGETTVDEKDLLYILITKAQDMLDYLIKEKHNPLLLYRLYKCGTLFSSSKVLRWQIKNYACQVKWNLLRHYMLRNRIVHSGYIPDNIALYHAQLDYYYHIMFENVVHFCGMDRHAPYSKIIGDFRAKFDLYLLEIDTIPDWKDENRDYKTDELAQTFKEVLHRKVIDPLGSSLSLI